MHPCCLVRQDRRPWPIGVCSRTSTWRTGWECAVAAAVVCGHGLQSPKFVSFQRVGCKLLQIVSYSAGDVVGVPTRSRGRLSIWCCHHVSDGMAWSGKCDIASLVWSGLEAIPRHQLDLIGVSCCAGRAIDDPSALRRHRYRACITRCRPLCDERV